MFRLFLIAALVLIPAELSIAQCRNGVCRRPGVFRVRVKHKSTVVQKSVPAQKEVPAASQKADASQKSAVQKLAEEKVQTMARRRIFGHLGGPFRGFTAEGVGFGATPEQALANCCRFNRPIVAQATAFNGSWFAIKLYR